MWFKKSLKKKSKRPKRLTRRRPSKAHAEFRLKIFALDGNKCANPLHEDWRKNSNVIFAMPDWQVAKWLSPHRIEYGSQCGKYTESNTITLCARCHFCVQNGFDHKKVGRVTAHRSMLWALRVLKNQLPAGRFRWQEEYEKLEIRFGLTNQDD